MFKLFYEKKLKTTRVYMAVRLYYANVTQEALQIQYITLFIKSEIITNHYTFG